ncbi:hypothetical protein [Burkholderia sp. CCA53]|uniref:hypothetical protein n=1 Tax=Burkholderia sp. CCA53 TaxID=1776288 RepID=UPI0020C7AA5E|nr:hypothetical protein [Burkholderia sp. CCA53]
MGLIDEAAAAPGDLAAALEAGVEQLSRNQSVTFQQYTKSTLPTDGYVFWWRPAPRSSSAARCTS